MADMMIQFWSLSALINIGMAVFNMLPLPPLDGFRIIKLITGKTYLWIEDYAPYIVLVIFALSALPGYDLIGVVIKPIIQTVLLILVWLTNLPFIIL